MANITPYGYRFSKKKKEMISTMPIDLKFEFTFPDGFVLVIDTREQDGLFQKLPKGLLVTRNTLQYGDYSIRGFELSVAIERKNLDDFWSSLTTHRERFGNELTALALYERKYILVEGVEHEALRPDLAGRKIHPNSIRQGVASIEAKLGIPVHYAASRADAERWLLDILLKYYHFKCD